MAPLHACLCLRQETYAEARQAGTVSAELDFSEHLLARGKKQRTQG